ncbi:MAG: transposase, partial [Crocinitomicaceae bacterium]|nr:transposase [Crocinitomicaceae bacterium]
MNILSFMEEFPTESACKAHFKDQREKEGVICKKCGSSSHYWLKSKDQWQCKTCDFRT